MASDTYYKDMWLRRNRSALQVVIVLLSVIAVVLVWQTVYRSRSGAGQSLPGMAQPADTGNSMMDSNHIRGRLFGVDHDEDDFDPGVDDDGDNPARVADCCTVYDLWQHSAQDYECRPLTEVDAELPATLVCPYPDEESNNKYNRLDAEAGKQILGQLDKAGEGCGFIDVGAGLGAHTFLATSRSHNVLAVEPNMNNVNRFHKAAKLGRYERYITLLHNHVGTSRDPVVVVPDQPEVKQILLDDLPAFCKFRKAVMRMNLDGQEHVAFQHAKFLFKEIQITYVHFDWDHLSKVSSDDDVKLVEDMIAYFNKRGYVPRGYRGRVLSIKKWQLWPNEIFWQKM